MDKIKPDQPLEQVELAEARIVDADYEGREKYEMDVDRMINEGLGGGNITYQNGLVDEPE